jgi:hypothetical protein
MDQDFNVISKTLKLLGEYIRKMLQDTNIGNGFLSKTPIAQGKKSTNRKI